jgi:nucleoside-diphosphate-sugar epimerase
MNIQRQSQTILQSIDIDKADITKAQSLLGYNPSVDLKDWIKANR